MSGESYPGGQSVPVEPGAEPAGHAVEVHPDSPGPQDHAVHTETYEDQRATPEHPVNTANRRFEAKLHYLAERLAPGAASADWREWPADPRTPSPVPGMIRVGYTWGRSPVLVPGVGQGAITVGNPALARPTTPTKPEYGHHTSRELVRKAQQEAAADTTERDRLRVAQLRAEHDTAVTLTAGYVTRAICSVAPGNLEVTLYDPRDTGAEFTGLAPMANEGMYELVGEGGISGLLAELNKDITTRYQGELDGFPSLRARAMYLGEEPPVPFKVVALLGNGEQLSAADQKLLDHAVAHASNVGITLLLHGFAPSNNTATHQISLNAREQRASTSAVTPDDFSFKLDGAPSPQIMWHAAQAATFDIKTRTALPRRTLAETAPIIRPTLDEYAQTLPNREYRREFTQELRRRRQVVANNQQFERAHPYLIGDEAHHAHAVNRRLLRRAGDQRAALDEARNVFTAGQQNDPTRAMASAAELNLHRGHWTVLNRARAMQYGTAAAEVVNRMLGPAMDLIRFAHGRDLADLPGFIREYTNEHITNQPPAWLYQLAVDQGVHRGGLTRNNDALQVIVEDIEATHERGAYNVEVRDEDGRVNMELLAALAELRLLDLYGYNDMTAENEQMRVLLTRRAELHVRDMSPAQLPHRDHATYVNVMSHLKEIGFTVTKGDRVAAAATSVGGLLGKLRLPSSDRTKDEDGANGDEPARREVPSWLSPDDKDNADSQAK